MELEKGNVWSPSQCRPRIWMDDSNPGSWAYSAGAPNSTTKLERGLTDLSE
jgi:hypothetical protein